MGAGAAGGCIASFGALKMGRVAAAGMGTRIRLPLTGDRDEAAG